MCCNIMVLASGHIPSHVFDGVLPQGDRVGICVTQFDPKQVERCLVATPGHLPTLEGENFKLYLQ